MRGVKLREFVLLSFTVPSIGDRRRRICISARVFYPALACQSQPFVERIIARYGSVATATFTVVTRCLYHLLIFVRFFCGYPQKYSRAHAGETRKNNAGFAGLTRKRVPAAMPSYGTLFPTSNTSSLYKTICSYHHLHTYTLQKVRNSTFSCSSASLNRPPIFFGRRGVLVNCYGAVAHHAETLGGQHRDLPRPGDPISESASPETSIFIRIPRFLESKVYSFCLYILKMPFSQAPERCRPGRTALLAPFPWSATAEGS